MGIKLSDHYRVEIDQLPDYLDNHILRVDLPFPKVPNESGTIAFDWWGVGFDAREEGYFTAHNPLTEIDDLNLYTWPDPMEPGLLDNASNVIESDQDRHFICCNFGFCLFERAWSLRGFEKFLMDMALDAVYSEDLLDRITDIQLVLIKRFIDLGVDGGYFGDDYGSQENLLFSPKTWRSLIKPRLDRMFAPFREAGLPIIMHSDGNIAEILPDLVDMGLRTLNPIQPEVLDHAWLRRRFGKNLSYYGGISTQTVLPYGSHEEIQTAVLDCARILAPENTGLILAPSHRLMTDIPVGNVDAMRSALALLEG
jgi:uroporphyrinogen decarboxylase